jgi:hypothetical protein
MTTKPIRVGSRVEIVKSRAVDYRFGVVVRIEDAPRKMTGGRGITVRTESGLSSGWDAEDMRVLPA